MPSEYNTVVVQEQPIQDQQSAQVKLCSHCHSPVDSSNFVYGPEAIVCRGCRDQCLTVRSIPDSRSSCIDLDPDPSRSTILDDLATTRRLSDRSHDEDTEMDPPPAQDSYYAAQRTHSLYAAKSPQPITAPPSHYRRQPLPSSPLTDITRLRVRSQGHHCLYPGASFQGTQKSGRNSYDVNVTIVDVDFNSSFLCGYLRIRGLTDDWPELTTFFDAEIIGSRYGFLTQNWGASEQEDMVHWSRFPAFRHVKHELKKPLMTMPSRDRGAVFMRWKERFLVPDHRVQDINGASFAGFYYVCVDFNPQSSARSSSQHMPLTPEEESFPSSSPSSSPLKVDTSSPRSRRDSSVQRSARSPSSPRHHSPPVASMSGFYYHSNSEPYQQLSLNHVPERATSSFEFR
ncbi:vacuolar import and degradation protein-domain-containing protein [Mycena floridula]|nr:vacuolar import and degradation protein-domain-containing protein [Mycena floridula]